MQYVLENLPGLESCPKDQSVMFNQPPFFTGHTIEAGLQLVTNPFIFKTEMQDFENNVPITFYGYVEWFDTETYEQVDKRWDLYYNSDEGMIKSNKVIEHEQYPWYGKWYFNITDSVGQSYAEDGEFTN